MDMADPVSLLQAERIRQALKEKEAEKSSAASATWRSYTNPVRVESTPVAATSVTTPPQGGQGRVSPSPSSTILHNKMAVATIPSFGFVLPTPLPAPTIVALPDPGLPAITTSLATGVRIPSSRYDRALLSWALLTLTLFQLLLSPFYDKCQAYHRRPVSYPPETQTQTDFKLPRGFLTTDTIPPSVNASPNTIVTVLRPASITPRPIPQYSSVGNLLVSSCATAEYTLIDAGSLYYYVPFVGCINNKQDCCPFTPQATSIGVYPQPSNQDEAILNHCPADYHSVSGGGCCPSGYTPWTAPLGGQTPCFSSVQARRTPQATTTYPGTSARAKPTVVVADTVFAMQYDVTEEPTGLSDGAVAGVVIGVIAGILLVAGLAYVFIQRRRARNPAIDLKSELGGGSSFRSTPAPHDLPGSTLDRQTSEVNNNRIPRRDFEAPPRYEAPSTERLRGDEPLRVQLGYSSRDDMSQKPTPTDQDDLDDGYPFESGANSPVQENTGILEVQLARPERLSRGYARIVYTQPQGSSSSMHTDGKSIRSNASGGEGTR